MNYNIIVNYINGESIKYYGTYSFVSMTNYGEKIEVDKDRWLSIQTDTKKILIPIKNIQYLEINEEN